MSKLTVQLTTSVAMDGLISAPTGAVMNSIFAPLGMSFNNLPNLTTVRNLIASARSTILESSAASPSSGAFAYTDDANRWPNGITLTDGNKLIGASVPNTIEISFSTTAANSILSDQLWPAPYKPRGLDELFPGVVATVVATGNSAFGPVETTKFRVFPILWVDPSEFSDRGSSLPSISNFIGTVTPNGYLIRNAGTSPVNNAFAWSLLPSLASGPGVFNENPLVSNALMSVTVEFNVVAQEITAQSPALGVFYGIPEDTTNNTVTGAQPYSALQQDGPPFPVQTVFGTFPTVKARSSAGFTFQQVANLDTPLQVKNVQLFDTSGVPVCSGQFGEAVAMYVSLDQELDAPLGLTGVSGVLNLGVTDYRPE